jgi:hypothetical protein
MLLLSLVFFQLWQRSVAVPIQIRSTNATDNGTVGWVETPQTRGTFDLLLSCLMTLSLCAWTAYHPNVRSGASEFQRFKHRAFWMCVAILFPELVLYCAWSQWWTARRFLKWINSLGDSAHDEELAFKKHGHRWLTKKHCACCCEANGAPDREARNDSDLCLDILFSEGGPHSPLQSEEEETTGTEATISDVPCIPLDPPSPINPSKVRRTAKWTMQQAFFALSGGFAIDLSAFSPQGSVTLTLNGLKFLALLGILPMETPETVADKSKADYVAKVLVCCQAGWFLIQCIARLAQNLPVSLLELHVLAHVLCAFCMYLVWIQKPYDVGSPILCTNEKVVDIGALFALNDPKVSIFHSYVPLL